MLLACAIEGGRQRLPFRPAIFSNALHGEFVVFGLGCIESFSQCSNFAMYGLRFASRSLDDEGLQPRHGVSHAGHNVVIQPAGHADLGCGKGCGLFVDADAVLVDDSVAVWDVGGGDFCFIHKGLFLSVWRMRPSTV